MSNRCKLFNRLEIFVHGKKDYISNSIIKTGCWEPTITNLFGNILERKRDNVIFDVGSNIGYYSILSSKYAKMVYSFEGLKENNNLLMESIKINNLTNIQVYNNCISDKKEFYEPFNNIDFNNCGNIGGLSFIKSETNSYCESITLDDFIEENHIEKIDLMKIDIEGGELKAIKGCLRTLSKNIIDNIIIEISPCFNDDSNEILSILKNNNYNLYNIPLKETGIFVYDKTYLSKICQKRILDIDSFVKSVDRQTNVLVIKNN